MTGKPHENTREDSTEYWSGTTELCARLDPNENLEANGFDIRIADPEDGLMSDTPIHRETYGEMMSILTRQISKLLVQGEKTLTIERKENTIIIAEKSSGRTVTELLEDQTKALLRKRMDGYGEPFKGQPEEVE